jgi:hypothetical protein
MSPQEASPLRKQRGLCAVRSPPRVQVALLSTDCGVSLQTYPDCEALEIAEVFLCLCHSLDQGGDVCVGWGR